MYTVLKGRLSNHLRKQIGNMTSVYFRSFSECPVRKRFRVYGREKDLCSILKLVHL